MLLTIVLAWETFKDWLSATVGLSHWDLHVIFGLGVFLMVGRLLRRPLTSFLPLLPALTLGPPLAVVVAARLWPTVRHLAKRLWFQLRFPPRQEHIAVKVHRDERLP